MKRTTTLIIGAGQCGLAMSNALTNRAIDHIVLERGKIGNSWKTERWDSLNMLTPNWMNCPVKSAQDTDNPDGFMPAAKMGAVLDRLAATTSAPVQQETKVLSLTATGNGYCARTNQGTIEARSVVIASGFCNQPRIPDCAAELSTDIFQTSPFEYKRPTDLPKGRVLIAGSSASGLNIARELLIAGREVTIAIGSHMRLPRNYRGQDICNWMDLVGVFDEPWTDADDLDRLRRLPSLPLIGGEDMNLNVLQAMGAETVGRLAMVRDGNALFSGGLAHQCASADLKMNRLLTQIDEWIGEQGLDDLLPEAERFAPVSLPKTPRLQAQLSEFSSVIWATGYKPDYSWLDLPIFDRKGRITHDGGVIGNGLYALGLPHLRRSRSTHVDGAEDDAEALADDLYAQLSVSQAA